MTNQEQIYQLEKEIQIQKQEKVKPANNQFDDFTDSVFNELQNYDIKKQKDFLLNIKTLLINKYKSDKEKNELEVKSLTEKINLLLSEDDSQSA